MSLNTLHLAYSFYEDLCDCRFCVFILNSLGFSSVSRNNKELCLYICPSLYIFSLFLSFRRLIFLILCWNTPKRTTFCFLLNRWFLTKKSKTKSVPIFLFIFFPSTVLHLKSTIHSFLFCEIRILLKKFIFP